MTDTPVRPRREASITSPKRRSLLRAAAAVGIAASCELVSSRCRAGAIAVGQPAPPLVLATLDGRSIATRDLIGQVVLVTFWATWCEPCRRELPLIADYASHAGPQGLQVLGFSLDGPSALPKVREVAASLGFPVGLLGSPYAGGFGRIWRIPVSFAIDRAGRLAHDGWADDQRPWTREQLGRVLDPLLSVRAGDLLPT
jgi:cytochrome c biogenesis protein CcmG, thiol:disulfide interchange protein DsbE